MLLLRPNMFCILALGAEIKKRKNKVGAQETRRKKIEIEVYWEERKVPWKVRMPIILGKMDEPRIPNILGRREYK